jgi:hypothetical protein
MATDVEPLLGTIKPLLMATTSPYGVEYVRGCRNQPGAAAPTEKAAATALGSGPINRL